MIGSLPVNHLTGTNFAVIAAVKLQWSSDALSPASSMMDFGFDGGHLDQ